MCVINFFNVNFLHIIMIYNKQSYKFNNFHQFKISIYNLNEIITLKVGSIKNRIDITLWSKNLKIKAFRDKYWWFMSLYTKNYMTNAKKKKTYLFITFLGEMWYMETPMQCFVFFFYQIQFKVYPVKKGYRCQVFLTSVSNSHCTISRRTVVNKKTTNENSIRAAQNAQRSYFLLI